MSRESDFVTLARQHARNFWEAYQELKSMQDEWNAQAYGDNLDSSDAFEGENENLNSTKVGGVIFDTMNAIETLMNQGHATNVTNLL